LGKNDGYVEIPQGEVNDVTTKQNRCPNQRVSRNIWRPEW
jgi:hypothetical protein